MKTVICILVAAMLALGVVTGLLVGLSASPVVGVVLPLLFSLLGGAGGFFVLKTDFSSGGPRQSLVAYSACVLSIATGTGLGVYIGIAERGGAPAWSAVAGGENPLFPPALKNDGAIGWMLLDARLHMLGLDRDERRVVLQRVSHEQGSDLTQYRSELRQAAESLEKAAPGEGVLSNVGEWQDLAREATQITELIELAPTGDESIGSALEAMHGRLGYLNDDEDDRSFIKSNAAAAAAVEEFKRAALRLLITYRGARSPLESANAQMAEFLEKHSQAARAALDVKPGRFLASTGFDSGTADS